MAEKVGQVLPLVHWLGTLEDYTNWIIYFLYPCVTVTRCVQGGLNYNGSPSGGHELNGGYIRACAVPNLTHMGSNHGPDDCVPFEIVLWGLGCS